MLCTIVAVLKREELQRLLAVQSLFSEDKITANLSDMGGAFLTVPASRGDGLLANFPMGRLGYCLRIWVISLVTDASQLRL